MCCATVLQLEIVSHMGKSVKQNKFPELPGPLCSCCGHGFLKAIKCTHSVMLFALSHRMCENSLELAR